MLRPLPYPGPQWCCCLLLQADVADCWLEQVVSTRIQTMGLKWMATAFLNICALWHCPLASYRIHMYNIHVCLKMQYENSSF